MPEVAVPVSPSSSLKQKLETGLAALIREVPPHLRPVARQLSPLLLGYLRRATEEDIREALVKVKGTINDLLEEG